VTRVVRSNETVAEYPEWMIDGKWLRIYNIKRSASDIVAA